MAPAAPGPLRGLGSPGTGLTETATVPLRLPARHHDPPLPPEIRSPQKVTVKVAGKPQVKSGAYQVLRRKMRAFGQTFKVWG